MKAYGKNRKFSKNFPDSHPPKGWVNWWEVEMGNVDKGRERQEAKREIRNEINEIESEPSNYEMFDLINKLNNALIESTDIPRKYFNTSCE